METPSPRTRVSFVDPETGQRFHTVAGDDKGYRIFGSGSTYLLTHKDTLALAAFTSLASAYAELERRVEASA